MVSYSQLPNHWNFFSVESDRDVSCYINEVTFGPHLRLGSVCQENHSCDWRVGTLSPSPAHLMGKERIWRLNQLPVANDLINHGYVMKPWWGHRGQGLESFQIGEHVEIWGEWCALRRLRNSAPFPMPYPMLSLPSVHSWVISFVIKLKS